MDFLVKCIEHFQLEDKLMKAVINNSSQTFKQVRTLVPTFIEGSEGYTFTKKDDTFMTMLENAYTSNEFQENYNFAKYIAYNNDNVKVMNTKVRRMFTGDNVPPLVAGDFMLGYQSVLSDWRRKTNLITNSAQYLTKDVEHKDSGYGFKIYSCAIDEIDEPYKTVVNIVDPDDYATFLKCQQERIQLAFKDKRKWRDYFAFKNNFLLIDNLAKLYNKKNYPKKDIDYGYGCTVHKSQGSTYNTVFVDGKNISGAYSTMLSNIGQNKLVTEDDEKFALRFTLSLMYVAVSRPTDFAMIKM
jgi:hypothetical protein